MVFAVAMKKIVTAAVLSCALMGAPAVASAAPVATAPVMDTGSGGSGSGASGTSEGALLCSPIAQFLFATGSAEKPPFYDVICLFV